MQLKINPAYRFWFKLTLIYLSLQFLIRSIFLAERFTGVIDSADTYLDGFAWDAGTWITLSLPLLILSALVPLRHRTRLNFSLLDHVLTFLFTFIFTFISFCEITFWNEFHSRFNFIAVDYLIYTNEVLANLKESYPIVGILIGVGIFSLVVTYFTSKIRYSTQTPSPRPIPRYVAPLSGIAFSLVFVLFIGPWLENHDEDFHDDQLSRNGVYEFVRAFRSNKIDYRAFYRTLPESEVEKHLQSLKAPKPSPYKLEKSKPNIVMIVVESLGAKFIGPLSDNKDTTPYLNKLAGESLFFEKFYATGTRTVRGLEALNLSIPPTPGYAVVKRPDHKGLYSLGHTFHQNGYDPIFLYGGRGFFDNMNSFFSGNHFKTIDQGDFQKKEITFSNAWGVCDEDLFNKAFAVIEKRTTSNPFLLFMLTTSNHRPFTYPEGKIDIPSGASRAGAVKYTDYAIGSFLKKAIAQKWAKDTIFVVVADHSTEGRGQFDLEMNDFHIPLWIYAPGMLRPEVIRKLGSQIDLLPTLIHMLGLEDDSPFYGRSLLDPNFTEERAFIGNYQYVGYYKKNVLTTLGPNQIVRNYAFDPMTKTQSEYTGESPYLPEAISYYQSASRLLDLGFYKPGKFAK